MIACRPLAIESTTSSITEAYPRMTLANSALDMERLRRLLTPADLILLSRYLFDGQSQSEIATSERCSQTTIANRIRIAVQKLTSEGIEVATPGKGRTRKSVRAKPFDHETLDRLHMKGAAGQEQRTGRWLRAKPTASNDET